MKLTNSSSLVIEAPNDVNVPGKYNEAERKIEIKPEDSVDQGLHKILVELVIKSMKNFHAVVILVKLPIKVFIRVLLVVNLILTIMNSTLIIKLNWNPPPSYFPNLLLITHMLASGLNLPGALSDFNQKVV